MALVGDIATWAVANSNPMYSPCLCIERKPLLISGNPYCSYSDIQYDVLLGIYVRTICYIVIKAKHFRDCYVIMLHIYIANFALKF